MSDQDTNTNEHLNQLVGEGKKYATIEDLAKGTIHANQFIDTLKQEKLELEEKLGIKTSQDNHLETIVNLLKPEVKPEPEPIKEPEPKKEEEKVIKQETPTDVSIHAKMNMEQFARDAVAKYGDAKTVGTHLQAYIGDDKGRQALVTNMMQTDPTALIKILPDKDKKFNPTGSGGTHQQEATLPLTWNDCLKVRKEDPAKYKSPSFVRQMMDARALAKEKGIPFGNV